MPELSARLFSYRLTLAIALSVALATALFITQAGASGEPDWNKATQEAAEHLSALVRIRTTQPEGNELQAARYLKAVCDREGIENYIFESAPGRGNFVARLKGDGSAKPILLMAHLDTVGVEPKLWSDDPFSGKIRDGYLYGRGSQDDKNILAAHLTALLLIKRAGVPLKRDIILLGEADEEQGIGLGIEWMIKNKPEWVDVEYSITEGGTSLLDAATGKVKYFGIQTQEKVPVNIKVETRGVSGHASIPRPDNPVVCLARAISSIGAYETPVKLDQTTLRFFEAVAAASTGEDKKLYDALVKAATAKNPDQNQLKQMAREVLAGNLRFAAVLRTTISPTVMNGGFQNNVIPGTAEANLNIRMLPDDTVGNVIEHLRRAVNDPLITFTPAKLTRAALPATPTDTEMFRAFEKSVKVMSPDTIVTPYMSTWATDSSQLRQRGVKAYGVLWPNTPDEEPGFHGNDERIRVSSLGWGTQLMWRVAMQMAAK
ncbi:MAG TPA: M20/M25/M40 family metallo-hydrolase [Blastocatellia bacterium]|nr:M20/M25/M40 family metallo-hydrolase [Blastocatellia bacterium]